MNSLDHYNHLMKYYCDSHNIDVPYQHSEYIDILHRMVTIGLLTQEELEYYESIVKRHC